MTAVASRRHGERRYGAAPRIPPAIWAAARSGTSGIWWTISLTAICRGLAMMLLWRAGGWRSKKV